MRTGNGEVYALDSKGFLWDERAWGERFVACMAVPKIHEIFPKGLLSTHRLAGLPQPRSC